MALLKNTSEIQSFLPSSVSADYDRLEPFCNVADDKFLKKLFGNAFWDEIVSENENPSADNKKLDKVIEMSKRAEIHLAYWKGFDVLNAQINDSGFHRIEDDQTKSLYNYQEKNLREYFKDTGHDTLDTLLEYLEDNIDETIFSTWKESDACTLHRKYFINSAKDFSEIYDIDKSRLVFLNLVPYMKFVEDKEIAGLIGDSLFTKMKTLISDGTISESSNAAYSNLLPKIQSVVAPYTVLYAIGKMGLRFSDKGAMFSDIMDTGGNIEKQGYDDKRAEEVKEDLKDRISFYMTKLSEHLMDNKDNLSEYADFIGDDYEEYDPGFDNSDKKIHRM
jgi:hypothetical protein